MAEWQPIETAPKDGSFILCAWQSDMVDQGWLFGVHMWRESAQHLGLYGWFFVCTERFHKPTHWMPLPEAPEAIDG